MKPGTHGTDGRIAHVSRRSFLQAGALGVTGLAAGAPRVVWAQDKGDAKRGGTLVVRSGPIRGIDPHLETWGAALQVVHQTYNALLKFNHDGTKILPDLAETWEQKDDVTYVFRLRQGVKFHNVPPVNGRELTSEDVKYSIERQMTNQPGKFQHAYFFLGKLDSIQTPDKYTVVFKTKEPYAPFLNYIASPWTVIVAREVVEKHGDLQRHAIGTGPFIMQEYRREQEALFVENPHYFKKGLPYLDEVRIQYVIDPSAATAAFRGQQTDISQLEFADVASIKASNAKVQVAEITTMFPIVLRTRPYDEQRPNKPPFAEKKVRQAIQAAIKPEEFIQIVRSGWGITMTGPIPTYRKPWALAAAARPQFDPAKAKRLLTEAGYASGLENRADRRHPRRQRQERPGREGPARQGGHPGEPEAHGDGPVLQQELHVRLLHERAHRAHGRGAQEAIRPYYGATATYYRWGNKEIHRLIDEQAKILDPKRRVEMIHQIQRMLLDDAPNVFLYTPITHYGVQPWVKNYTVPINAYDQRYEEIWLDGKKA